MKPRPDEFKLVCRWFMDGKKMRGNETCDRINWLTHHYFRQVAQGNWETLYEDPETQRFWLLTYPLSHMHGGGPPSLEEVTTEYASSKFFFKGLTMTNTARFKHKSEFWTPESPATPADIEQAELSLGIKFAQPYRDLLLSSNGGYGEIPVQPGGVEIYQCSALAEDNIGYEVAQWLPGYFLFGTNGGGEAFVVELKDDRWPVYIVPFIGMKAEERIEVAPSFEAFLDMLGSGEWIADDA